MKAQGKVFRYKDNVDTDVIIPARYLNTSVPSELAKHCMEDIDKDFVNRRGQELRLRLFERTRAHRHQGFGNKLRYRLHVRAHLLPQLHQYRPADHRVRGGRQGHQGGGYRVRRFRYGLNHKRNHGEDLSGRTVPRIHAEYHQGGRTDPVHQREKQEIRRSL